MIRPSKTVSRILVLVLLLSGCSDDQEGGDSDAGQPHPPAGPCAIEEKIGVFKVMHEPDYSAISGEVTNGVVPSTILEEVAAEGGCRLMQRGNPFCDPVCPPGETCDFNGVCIPYPEQRSVGNVTINGLNKTVSMDPSAYFDASMPHPGFDPGADISLVAAGEDYEGFAMWGVGVTPLELPDSTWSLQTGQPLEVTWIPAEDGENVEVHLSMNVDQHGNTPVTLYCDLPDTGSTAIPAALIDALLGYGITGFASGHIFRRTVDHIDVADGCIQLEVFSHLTAGVDVEQ